MCYDSVPTSSSPCPVFPPSVYSCPSPCLPLPLLLFCLSWYTFSSLVFLFILCFLLCFSHSFPPSVHLCLHPVFPPPSTAHCVRAAEEAASPSPCPESMCGSGSCFSPPFCARTSASSRILRQVGPGVQVWDSPGHFLPLSYPPSQKQPLFPPTPTVPG